MLGTLTSLAELHRCETYADMVPEPKTSVLDYNMCQNEFVAMPDTLKMDPEEIDSVDLEGIKFVREAEQGRGMVLANMEFADQVFLRSLPTAKIISSVIQERLPSFSLATPRAATASGPLRAMRSCRPGVSLPPELLCWNAAG